MSKFFKFLLFLMLILAIIFVAIYFITYNYVLPKTEQRLQEELKIHNLELNFIEPLDFNFFTFTVVSKKAIILKNDIKNIENISINNLKIPLSFSDLSFNAKNIIKEITADKILISLLDKKVITLLDIDIKKILKNKYEASLNILYDSHSAHLNLHLLEKTNNSNLNKLKGNIKFLVNNSYLNNQAIEFESTFNNKNVLNIDLISNFMSINIINISMINKLLSFDFNANDINLNKILLLTNSKNLNNNSDTKIIYPLINLSTNANFNLQNKNYNLNNLSLLTKDKVNFIGNLSLTKKDFSLLGFFNNLELSNWVDLQGLKFFTKKLDLNILVEKDNTEIDLSNILNNAIKVDLFAKSGTLFGLDITNLAKTIQNFIYSLSQGSFYGMSDLTREIFKIQDTFNKKNKNKFNLNEKTILNNISFKANKNIKEDYFNIKSYVTDNIWELIVNGKDNLKIGNYNGKIIVFAAKELKNNKKFNKNIVIPFALNHNKGVTKIKIDDKELKHQLEPMLKQGLLNIFK